MPELPEVEATRHYLISVGLLGRRFTHVELLWPRAVRMPPLEEFVLAIRHRRVEDLGRRAKFLLFGLDGGGALVIHLRMTGSLLVEPADTPRPAMTRNIFIMDDGRELRFVDPRKLGQIWLVDDTGPLFKHLGPEPLEPGFTPQVLERALAARTVPVKALLCDQQVIAGIGNIYADEILFASSINPLRPGSSLSALEMARLHSAIVKVLAEATERLTTDMPFSGPLTQSVEGLSHLQVSRQRDGICVRCGAILMRVLVRGRSTYHCSSCQT